MGRCYPHLRWYFYPKGRLPMTCAFCCQIAAAQQQSHFGTNPLWSSRVLLWDSTVFDWNFPPQMRLYQSWDAIEIWLLYHDFLRNYLVLLLLWESESECSLSLLWLWIAIQLIFNWQFCQSSVQNNVQPLGLSVVGRIMLMAQFINVGAASAEIWDKPHIWFLPQLGSELWCNKKV